METQSRSTRSIQVVHWVIGLLSVTLIFGVVSWLYFQNPVSDSDTTPAAPTTNETPTGTVDVAAASSDIDEAVADLDSDLTAIDKDLTSSDDTAPTL